MKKYQMFLPAIIATLLLCSCKKENPNVNTAVPLSGTATSRPVTLVTIRYEFVADVAAAYGIFTSTGAEDVAFAPSVSASWSGTSNVPKTSGGTGTATFTVFPPSEWMKSHGHANVSMKIFENGKLMVAKSGVMIYVDKSPAFSISAPY